MVLIWLLIALGLIAIELVVPTAFVSTVMGVAALGVAALSLSFPWVAGQFVEWMLASVGLAWGTRRWVKLSGVKNNHWDPVEAETLTEIPAGQSGRVLYDGGSWRALCAAETQALAPDAKVYVVGRKGTTLLVVPQINALPYTP